MDSVKSTLSTVSSHHNSLFWIVLIVLPAAEYQVVTMLQQRGHLTGMTGDGVNDAPSLKRADCGIAVQGASDAAQAAADVVFLDEGLSTIITAIKVSRQIFSRMKAYIGAHNPRFVQTSC